MRTRVHAHTRARAHASAHTSPTHSMHARPLFLLTSCLFLGLTRSGSYFARGETLPDTGNTPGNATRNILVCELLVSNTAVRATPPEIRPERAGWFASWLVCKMAVHLHPHTHTYTHGRTYGRFFKHPVRSDITVIFRNFSQDPLSLNSENAALINCAVH